MKPFLLFCFISCCSLFGYSQKTSTKEHVELGDVNWHRSYDDALQLAQKQNKAVLILFQEVPGCATCRNYGNNVLTHPLLVDAIQTSFVPLCVFNNNEGEDLKILKKYGEPTWNNPVVRIVDPQGKDLIRRVSGNYSKAGLITAMNSALIANGELIPEYMSLLEEEWTSKQETCYLSMYCFWTGEKEIAKIPGVTGTQAGFMHGKEVVRVDFDNSKTNAQKIQKMAAKKSCGDQLYTEEKGYRKDKESKYFLQHSPLKYIPMTPLQSTKINSALAYKEDYLPLLSPIQKALLKKVNSAKGKGFKNVIEQDIRTSFAKL